MTFASISFVIFFPAVVVLYYLWPVLFPGRFRWALLLAASCYFYMAFIPQYILILLAIILIDFVAAQQIAQRSGHARRLFFILSVISNIGILFVFKYFNFFNDNIAVLAQAIHWNYSIESLSLILPLGLSFHTFQSLSYVIEVYRGNYPAERHLGIYALYVMFFPQLIAGPIERPAHLLPQFKVRIRFDIEKVLSGLRLMLWGFFKKVVVADRLAIAVDYVWHHTATVPGPGILAAIVFFSVQLYADFSGYSDIARGSARVLGIEVVNNFNRPYFSASVSEFWRRWHISLSSWFRDYVYIPLGGNRVSRWKQYRNTLIVFLTVGVWHGAGWTFVTMGLLFGLYISVGLMTRGWREAIVQSVRLTRLPRVHHALQVFFTFALISFGWIFFRAPNMPSAFTFIRQLFEGWTARLPLSSLVGLNRWDMMLLAGSVAIVWGVEFWQGRRVLTEWFERQSQFVRGFTYAGMILSILVFGVFSTQQFIYFQF